MPLNETNKDPTHFTRELTDPSMLQLSVAASTAKTFSLTGASDGYPVKAIRFNAAGTFECTDWNDVTHSITTLAGEVLDIMPKTVTTNTTVAWLGFYA
jgi:hypothetical protein